jgi:hypothetical protein
MGTGMTSTSAFSPAASFSRKAVNTSKMKTTLFPVCCSNFGVSCAKTSFGAPPLITLISLADKDILVTINAENAINPEIFFIGVLSIKA